MPFGFARHKGIGIEPKNPETVPIDKSGFFLSADPLHAGSPKCFQSRSSRFDFTVLRLIVRFDLLVLHDATRYLVMGRYII